MKRTGFVIIGLALIVVVISLMPLDRIGEDKKSIDEISKEARMDIKELEEKVLSKNWDALDIVDTAAQPQQALDKLTELLGHEDPGVREIALDCVSYIQDARVPKLFAQMLSDEDGDVRLSALQFLQTTADESIVSELAAALDNDDGEIRGGAALLLGQIGRVEAVEPLERRVEKEESESAVRDMRLALARLGNDEMKNVFADQMDAADTRLQGLEDLRYISDKNLAHRIMPALDDTGEANQISPPSVPKVEYNRVCDVAINLIAELHDRPFSFETNETKIYSDDEIKQVKTFLNSLMPE